MIEKKRFLLRVDARVYDALEKWAADELRSVNSQMEFLLTEALRKARRLEPPPTRAGSRADPTDV